MLNSREKRLEPPSSNECLIEGYGDDDDDDNEEDNKTAKEPATTISNSNSTSTSQQRKRVRLETGAASSSTASELQPSFSSTPFSFASLAPSVEPERPTSFSRSWNSITPISQHHQSLTRNFILPDPSIDSFSRPAARVNVNAISPSQPKLQEFREVETRSSSVHAFREVEKLDEVEDKDEEHNNSVIADLGSDHEVDGLEDRLSLSPPFSSSPSPKMISLFTFPSKDKQQEQEEEESADGADASAHVDPTSIMGFIIRTPTSSSQPDNNSPTPPSTVSHPRPSVWSTNQTSSKASLWSTSNSSRGLTTEHSSQSLSQSHHQSKLLVNYDSLSNSQPDNQTGMATSIEAADSSRAGASASMPKGREWKGLTAAASSASSLSFDDLKDPNWQRHFEQGEGRIKPAATWSVEKGAAEQIFEPSRRQKQKHQINWLAQNAANKELEILERSSQQKSSRYQTSMKYGW